MAESHERFRKTLGETCEEVSFLSSLKDIYDVADNVVN